jgi:hypothetical protein
LFPALKRRDFLVSLIHLQLISTLFDSGNVFQSFHQSVDFVRKNQSTQRHTLLIRSHFDGVRMRDEPTKPRSHASDKNRIIHGPFKHFSFSARRDTLRSMREVACRDFHSIASSMKLPNHFVARYRSSSSSAIGVQNVHQAGAQT